MTQLVTRKYLPAVPHTALTYTFSQVITDLGLRVLQDHDYQLIKPSAAKIGLSETFGEL